MAVGAIYLLTVLVSVFATDADSISRTDQGPIQCPEPYFRVLSQCFRLYDDKRRSWEESKALCYGNGLVLAHPKHPIDVRAAIVERGQKYAWLNARGDGTVMVWEDTDDYISNTNALWFHGQPGSRVTADYCLRLLSIEENMNSTPVQPLLAYTCSSTKTAAGRGLYALCELK
ncbi:unnamed protein product [Meganyctiphanes norvegica]|uniref:C-type lectin domain-containing protein n=1 Tax=Meganyctiphanes norvegica TaxID=48144 RepID=A0AAV2RNZ4_MEGNR